MTISKRSHCNDHIFQVSPDVKAISASESGELWAVLDRVVPDSVIPAALVDVLVGPGSGIPGAPGAAGLQPAANARGVLARRSGVTPEQVAGTGWDIALGVSRICFVDRFQLLLSRYAFHVQIMLHFSCREVGSPFAFGERGRTIERLRL